VTEEQPGLGPRFDPNVASIELSTLMGGTRALPRTHPEVLRFFDGLDMIEPGLVQLHRWRSGIGVADTQRNLAAYGGVGCRP
jgi:hypothetical protein